MKITTRCGSGTVEALNAQLVAAGVEAGVIDMGWLRADTTVVPADIKCPTDSGLLTKGISRIAALVTRIQAEGIAPRTPFTDESPAARQGAHRIGSKLRRRNDDANAEVLAITGELADLAETTVERAKRVLVNAKRMGERPVRRLRRMLADLAHLLDSVTQVIAQTRLRIAGQVPPAKTRRVSLSDGDARPIRKGSLATPTQFGYTGQVTDNRDGIVVDYGLQAGMPPDAPRLAPAIARAIIIATKTVPDAVTADRGYGEATVDAALTELGVDLVAILRKGQESPANSSRPNPVSLRWSSGEPEPRDGSPRGNANTDGASPHPRSRRSPNLVWLGNPQPQRDQDRRPLQLSPRATT